MNEELIASTQRAIDEARAMIAASENTIAELRKTILQLEDVLRKLDVAEPD